jgi:hypothetical protein
MVREISGLRAIFRRGVENAEQAGAGGLPGCWEALAAEFPNVEIRPARGTAATDTAPGTEPGTAGLALPSLPPLRVEDWTSQFFNFYELDAQLDALAERDGGPFTVVVFSDRGEPEALSRTVREVLTRCQRWTDRRNGASRGGLFDRVLAEHRETHDLSKPLVRADYDHALDTWQWTLRLEPEADLPLQLAALFHDVERLASEADARIEHHAGDYQAFKDDHAERGAELAEALLGWVGVDAGTRQRAARLIAAHERPPAAGDPYATAIALLNDADALSFFSLNSLGYLDYFGREATQRKVAYTLRRLRPEARRHLAGMRLRSAIQEAIEEEEAAETAAPGLRPGTRETVVA